MWTNAILTHWGRVTHICVGKLTIIGSDNGLSPSRRQAIIRTNAGMLLIGTLGTNFSEILSEIHTFSFKEMHLKMPSGRWLPFCLGLNGLIWFGSSRTNFNIQNKFTTILIRSLVTIPSSHVNPQVRWWCGVQNGKNINRVIYGNNCYERHGIPKHKTKNTKSRHKFWRLFWIACLSYFFKTPICVVSCLFERWLAPKSKRSIGITNCSYHSTRVELYILVSECLISLAFLGQQDIKFHVYKSWWHMT